MEVEQSDAPDPPPVRPLIATAALRGGDRKRWAAILEE